jgi:hypothetical protein
MPFAPDDSLIAELRDARPEPPADLIDPHAPANEAILRSILDAAPQPNVRPLRRHTPARVAVAAAAAAAITVGVVVAGPFGQADPSAADVIRTAAAASEDALDSGRAEVTVRTESTGYPEAFEDIEAAYLSTDTYAYSFDGQDVAVQMSLGEDDDGEGGYPGERRIVDGEMYWHAGPDPTSPWFHDADDGDQRSDWTGDPRSLLDTLEPRAGFELVGDEEVDGVEVTHLRSTTPSYFDPQNLGLGQALNMAGGPLTRLEVWVDGDGVVRRIEVEATHGSEVSFGVDDGAETAEITQTASATVRFVDIGVPNTVEAPPTSCGVTDDDMANPPPPGGPIPGC